MLLPLLVARTSVTRPGAQGNALGRTESVSDPIQVLTVEDIMIRAVLIVLRDMVPRGVTESAAGGIMSASPRATLLPLMVARTYVTRLVYRKCAWSNNRCIRSHTSVNYGGHRAPNCGQCPSGHGRAWCKENAGGSIISVFK